MGCEGPGVVSEYDSAFSIACFSVALYWKAGEENRGAWKWALGVLGLCRGGKQKLGKVSDPSVIQMGMRGWIDQAERADGNILGYQSLEASGEGHELPVAAIWWEQGSGNAEEPEGF